MRGSSFLTALALGYLLLPNTYATTPEKVVGVWNGVLKVPGAELRVRFTVTKDGDALKAAMDSLDQGATGIPCEVSFSEGEVSFKSVRIGGGFTGSLSDDGKTLTGNWSQGGQTIPLVLARQAPGESQAVGFVADDAFADKILGTWQGTLKPGSLELRVVFSVVRAEDRSLTGHMISIDQSPQEIPIRIAAISNGVAFKVAMVNGGFEGTFSADGNSLEGAWTQVGNKLPLTLVRNEVIPENKRPQEPKPPFPYSSKDVTFPNKAGGFDLAGTLTMPEGEGPFPVAILVSGSGPQDRNEELMGHKPFLVLADHLTRKGIAVLRYDDRGTEESGGEFSTATSADFCDDTLSAAAWLKTQAGIDPAKIGIIGHSEGGLIAPMAAGRSKDIAFVVLMAGPAVSGEAVIYEQSKLIMRAAGISDAIVAGNREMQEKMFDLVRRSEPGTDLKEPLIEMMKEAVADMTEEEKAALGATEGQMEGQAARMASPWFRFFLFHDPVVDLEKLKIPTLALFGANDLQVPPAQSRHVMESALKKAGNKHYRIEVLDKLNHLFQTSETGSPAEYAKIEETISPKALALIGDWVLEVTKSSIK
ncbi:MAG: alpha/beta fold hydrolase [Acidobacteriota bacterium]|nr:alpha/beta fold hydrolase [Acidobacteriota bacterium]